MKKLDSFLLTRFLLHFITVLPCLVLILITQYLLKYFEDFVGKGVDIWVFGQLFAYFSINMLPRAMGLSILLSSLMTYGTLGEHAELTAIKAAGVSPLRLFRPVFLASLLLTILSFYANADYIPRVNLKAFLLLYDIQHKKPAFYLPEKQFYGALPGYSVRVEKKTKKGALEGVIIYGHSARTGEKRLILAQSGEMNESKGQELLFTLYNGNYYIERPSKKEDWHDLIDHRFEQTQLRFDLSSFSLVRRDESFFSHLRYGKSMNGLLIERDSIRIQVDSLLQVNQTRTKTLHELHLRYDQPITLPNQAPLDLVHKRHLSMTMDHQPIEFPKQYLSQLSSKDPPAIKSIFNKKTPHLQNFTRYKDTLHKGNLGGYTPLIQQAYSVQDLYLDLRNKLQYKLDKDTKRISIRQASFVSSSLSYLGGTIRDMRYRQYWLELEAYNRIFLSLSGLIFFLIGASIGIVIKKGGLGLPVSITCFFLILFYVLTVLFNKRAASGLTDTVWASAAPCVILAIIALLLVWMALWDTNLLQMGGFQRFIFQLRQWYHRYLSKLLRS